jgi:glycerophosphoryl diester phosphodiesterase
MRPFPALIAVALLWFQATAQNPSIAQPNPGRVQLTSQKTQLFVSAHRGGRFLPGLPENALPTFRHTLRKVPAIIECDVNMSADSVLLLMHDQTLDRTTTGSGRVMETDWKTIRSLRLKDDFGNVTPYKVPRLSEILKWSFGKTYLMLDVKRKVPFDRVIQMVRAAGAVKHVALITYNYEDAVKAYLIDPRIKLSVVIRNEAELERYLNGPIPTEQLLAFTGLTARSKSFYQRLKKHGIITMLGTIGNLDNKAKAKGNAVYQELKRLGIDIFATDRPEAVYQALRHD